jgi:hypothetical protein
MEAATVKQGRAGQVRKAAGASAAVVLLSVAASFWMPVSCHDSSLRGREFSPSAWQSVSMVEEGTAENPRMAMVEDLVQRVGLVGRTEREVENLLGRGSSWALGPTRRTMGSHQEFLSVRFGPEGRVVEVRHPGLRPWR